MRLQNTTGLICLVTFSALIAFSAPWRGEAEEAKKIDLSATAKFVENWASRETFPDSPSFGYQNVFCQLALGGQVSDGDRNKIIGFLRECQKPDGGFVSGPDLKDDSNVIFTYFALASLDLIDAPAAVDRQKAVDFVLSLVQKDGGMKATAGGSQANLGTTCYGIRSLYLLKALERIDKDKTVAYIKSHRDNDKGFGVLAGKPSAPQSTFMAVQSLKLLGGLTDDVRSGVIRFLMETPYSGLREPANLALMTMENTAYVLETAAVLSALQELDAKKIHEFVESLYIPENGGFGPSPGLGTTPPSTYYGVESLVKPGRVKDPCLVRQ